MHFNHIDFLCINGCGRVQKYIIGLHVFALLYKLACEEYNFSSKHTKPGGACRRLAVSLVLLV